MTHKLHKDKLTVVAVLADLHYPYQHKATLSIFKQVCADLTPDYFINLGDAFDAEFIGRWTNESVESGIYKTIQEIEGYKKIHHKIVESCNNPDLVQLWCGGNHDWQRIDELIQEMPDRAELLDLNKHFPDVDICQYNEHHKIGKLFYTHGVYTNDAHAKKHVLSYGASVMYGHTHSVQVYTSVSRGSTKPHMAFSSPVGCKLNPKFMKNRPNSWINGFQIVYYAPNGNFQVVTVTVFNGQAMFNGKLYKG